MPFPFSSNGTIEVPGVSVDQALKRIEAALAKANARDLRRDGPRLQFHGGVFRLVWSWNILGPISTGLITVAPSNGGVSLTYRILFVELLVMASLMVALMFWIMPPGETNPGLMLAAWSWLFGGNYVVTLWRFPRFLVRSVG